MTATANDKASVHGCQDLIAWKKSMELVVECYRVSAAFPKSEIFGLTGQLRRAVVSVAANIVEGHSRRRTMEFLHHLDIAYGSLSEAEKHIDIAVRLKYMAVTVAERLFAQTA